MAKETLLIIQAFEKLDDPRVEDARKLHELLDIVVIAVCAVVSGAEDWVHIAQFGRIKEPWFREFLELRNGVPSHDTFRRVFSILDKDKFLEVFTNWTSALSEATEKGVVAIDGKSLRRAMDRKTGLTPIHLVQAWSYEAGICLGQLAVREKSNEIDAIPRLLELLSLKGCTVTIDAMGCQKEIAAKIVEKEAGYALALKKNHPTLHAAVENYFKETPEDKLQIYETTDGGEHGRIEVRKYLLSTDIAWSGADTQWDGLKAFGAVISTREINSKITTETRLYLTTLTDVKEFGAAVRNHWSIENSLHWVLDVNFNEDSSRAHVGNSAFNLALLRKFALNLIKKESSQKMSFKGRKLMATWDTDYMQKVVGFKG